MVMYSRNLSNLKSVNLCSIFKDLNIQYLSCLWQSLHYFKQLQYSYIVHFIIMQESLDYKLLCYCLEIICLCIDEHLLCVKCIQAGLLELAEKLANGFDATVRLISKAIIGHLIVELPSKVDDIVSLTEEEMAPLLMLLQAGSHNPLYISDCTIVSMLKSFMNNKTNVEQFEKHKLTCLLEQKWNSSKIDVIIAQLNSSSLNATSTVENAHIPSQDTGILQ